MNTPSHHRREPELPERLLEQMAWLRRLAGALIRDPEWAEDLVQDTLVVALERPPREPGALKGWLRRVLVNRHREGLREGASRRHREQRGARPEALEAADELVGRLQLQQRLGAHLLALDEPLRDALLMRYVDDLPPREIAARLDVPVATVKSRLARGLARLRERMDDEHGGKRSTWMAALLPLASETTTATTLGLGGLTVGLKTMLAAAGLVAATAWLWPRDERTAEAVPHSVATRPKSEVDRGAGSSGVRSESSTTQRRSTTAAPAPTTAAQPIEREFHAVLGQVIDAEGRGLAGVRVRVQGDERSVESGADGAFELESDATTARIEAADERFVALRTSAWRAEREERALLMVAPAVTLGGRVIDGWGRGVEGARLRIHGPEALALPSGVSLAATYAGEWTAQADENGRFDFGRVPFVEGFQVHASHTGFVSITAPLPSLSTTDLLLELAPPQPAPGQALAGRVVRSDGLPASDALVALGLSSTTTDPNGEFLFDLSRAGDARRLCAIESGFLPVFVDRPEQPTADRSGWPAFVELTLERRALSIAGRVVNSDGAPRSDVRVWLADSERFSLVGRVPVSIEALAAGGAPPEEAIESLAKVGDGESYSSARPVYAPNALVHWATTDSDGRFRLDGLQDREYVLNVADSRLTWGTITDPIAAGSEGVEIVADLSSCYEKVRGRALTRRGDPAPGVGITTWVTATSQMVEETSAPASVTRFFLGAGVTTDEQGRFELSSIPRQNLRFFLYGDGILPSYASSDDIADPDDFRIEVVARVSFEFETTPGPEAPDSLRISGVDGEPLDLFELRADGYSNFAVYKLENGRTGVLSLTTEAATLHLLRGELELSRIPLDPRPGKPLVVRW